MVGDPYTPPKARVADVLPDAPKYRVRTKWLYFCGFILASVVIFHIQDVLIPSLSPGRLTVGLMLALSVSVLPGRVILRRQPASSSLWREMLSYAAFSPALIGAIVHDELLIVVGFSAGLITFALLALTAYIVEARYSLRIYSQGRTIVFIKDTDAL